jgi:hypothetical protein
MKVQLETRDGGFVHAVEIPPMSPPPEVISWGTRVFVHRYAHTSGSQQVFEPEIYVEGLLWPIVELARDARRI